MSPIVPRGVAFAASGTRTPSCALIQCTGRTLLRLYGSPSRFDLTVLDCPPSLGLLTVNALTAAEALLIPTPPQAVDLQGLRLFWETVERIRLGPFAGSGIRPPARLPRRPPETAGRPARRPLPFAPPASAEPSASVPEAPAAPDGQRRHQDAYQDSPT